MTDLIRHSNNQTITLTKEIADSGEGKVWHTNLNGYLAKIYHDPTPARIKKLKVMLANPPTDPMLSHNHVSIAWVTDLLQDSNSKYVGFIMPAIENSKPLSSICNPRLRKRNAPGFNWYYLHVTALNTAWIIQAIHHKGYVLGDIKLENILVNDRAMTAVIDTDSFQVRDKSTKKIYRCTVGSEGFTPPELIGKDFNRVNQSQNQDRFRLGVLIHYLLFGYHPFSGNWTGVGESPEQSELIKHGYWYGGNNSPIRESKTTISLDIVHPELKQLFLRCFNDGHEQPHLRPTATDWHRALKVAVNELTACSRVDSHYYSKHYGSCYWCDRATSLGVDIFPGVAGKAKIPSQIKQISRPPTVPTKYRKKTTTTVHNTQNSKQLFALIKHIFEALCFSLFSGAFMMIFSIVVVIPTFCLFHLIEHELFISEESLTFSEAIVGGYAISCMMSIFVSNFAFVVGLEESYINKILICVLSLIYKSAITYIYYKTSIIIGQYFNIDDIIVVFVFIAFGSCMSLIGEFSVRYKS